MTQRKRPSARGLLKHRATLPSIIAIGVFAVVLAADAVVQYVYKDKVLPYVYVGTVDLGGMSYVNAEKQVQQAADEVENNGLTFMYGEKSVPLEFTLIDSNGLGLAADILSYDVTATVDAAFAVGHHNSFLRDTWDRFRVMVLRPGARAPVYALESDTLKIAIHRVVEKYETPVVEPGYTIRSNGDIGVTASKAGKMFDAATLQREVDLRARSMDTGPISAELRDIQPSMSASEASKLTSEVKRIVGAGTLTLHAGEQKISVKPATFVTWFLPVKEKQNKVPTLSVSHDAVAAFLTALAPQVNVPPKNARFYIENGTVRQLNTGSNGSELDADAALAAIAKNLITGDKDITLPMKEVKAQAGADNIANLGIREIVGSGTTSFAGSPANRRHNIKVGADLLNGLLIKPGEEFSTITAVGPVDATSGYLQELVIKGNKTTPEFGGGLCQIGTTFFRAVMNAGLPVLERKNHSYRVSYYEPPAGMDATIYEPKPDLRFKNDYKGYLLVQAHINGDKLTFEFWGTKDGRTVSTTTPRLYNYVSPPPQQTIETLDIPVGTTKCTEKAHTGADAEFTYAITSPDGTVNSQVFKSHYRPWQAVCLVGVKKLSAPKETDGNANTNSNANTNTNKNSNANANTNSNVDSNTNESVEANVNANANTSTPVVEVNSNTNVNSNTSP